MQSNLMSTTKELELSVRKSYWQKLIKYIQRCVRKQVTSSLKEYRIRVYRSGDKIADLDLTDDDGSDPLGVDEFFKNKAEFFLKKRFCSIFIILYHEKIVGCFTLSMHGIQKKYVNDKESIDEENISIYPCVLLGQIVGYQKLFAPHLT